MGRKRNVKSAARALSYTAQPIVADAAPSSADPQKRGSAWDGLQNVLAGLGNERDKRSYSSYGVPLTADRVTLDNMFRSSWLAGRIVTTVADDMTREWITRTWDGYDQDDLGIKSVQRAEGDFGVRLKVHQAQTWARLYGGSVIVIGIRGEDMATPLDITKIKKGSLQFLHVLDRWRIAPLPSRASNNYGLDDNFDSPNFGLPERYIVAESSQQIHWSRVVRFGGRPMPWFLWVQNQMWDDSELQHVQEAIQDYDGTKGGIASMVWEANVDILKTSVGDILAGAGGEGKLTKRFQLAATMKSFNRMLLIDKDEEWQQKTTQFSGLVDVLGQFVSDVCGAAEIPVERLFGQSPKGLNSTGEGAIRNYYDHVSARQETQLRSPLSRIDEVLIRSTLGRLPENYAFEFAPLWQTSAKENAEIELLRSQRDTAYWKMGALTPVNVARELHDVGTYRTLESGDVDLLEEMANEPAPEPTAAPAPAIVPGSVPVASPIPVPVPKPTGQA